MWPVNTIAGDDGRGSFKSPRKTDVKPAGKNPIFSHPLNMHQTMKRTLHSRAAQQSAGHMPATHTTHTRTRLKRLRLGAIVALMLAAALLPGALHAQTSDLRSFIITDGADYRGHILTPHNFVNMAPISAPVTDGYLAVGNRISGSSHDKVHLLCIPDEAAGNAVTGSLVDITNTSDIRAVAITPAGLSQNGNPGNAIVLQARGDQNITSDHIDVVLVDADDPGHTPMIYGTYRLVDQAGGNLYPTSAVFDGNQTLFICGIYTTTNPYPNEPALADSKEAFVASLDISSGIASIQTYNSTVNPTFPIAPWPGGWNDYDAALRLRIINGNLMVVGSANGTATTMNPVGGGTPIPRQVNYSETWVANIDMSSLGILAQSHFGTQQVPDFTSPANAQGTYGMDIMEDVAGGNGDYYVVQNRLVDDYMVFHSGWFLTHIDNLVPSSAPLQPSTTGSGNNTLFDTTIAGKMLGAVRHAGQHGTDRITMYGIELPWMSAMSFDITFSPSTGMAFNNPAWWWYQSLSGGSMGTPDPDFWLSSDLRIWSLPDMGAQFGAGSNPDYLGLMDYTFNSGGFDQPRFIQGGPDGEYVPGSKCDAWINQQTAASGIYFRDMGTNPMIPTSGSLTVDVPQANINDRQHNIFSCNNGDPYRLTHNTANASLPAGELRVSPNPGSDYVDASWGGTLKSNDLAGLRLQDMTGREVYAATAHPVGNSAHFALPQLAGGLYMATFTLNGVPAKTVKLSIQQ
jgi:hypothetical protein